MTSIHKSRLLLTAALAVASSILTGCQGGSNNATVEGSVLVDGDLATSGTVVFNPADGKGSIASGQIFKNGNYSVGIGKGDLSKPVASSLPSGDYVVTVSITGPSTGTVGEGGPPLAGPSLIAAKYNSTSTTDLKYTVKPGKNVIDLQLEGAAAADPSLEAIDPAEEAPAGETPAAEAPATEAPAETAPPAEAPPADAPAADSPAEGGPAVDAPAAPSAPAAEVNP